MGQGVTECTLAVLLFAIVCFNMAAFTAGRQHGRHRGRSRQASTKRVIRRTECTDFVTMHGMFTADGDVTVLSGHNMTSRQCRRQCLRQPNARYCVAANLRYGGTCILAGYSLFKNSQSTHYRRFCTHGRGCFKQIEGWETRFHTGIIAIPEMVRTSPFVMADFCRRLCEQLIYCVGFDVQMQLRYCPFLEIRPSHNPYYNMSLRNCSNRPH